MPTIHAVYEGGVFKPTEPVALPENTTVEFEPRVVPPPVSSNPAIQAFVDWLRNRTPEEIEKAREEGRKASRPPAPLPPGKTLSDMVEGKWPGDETDEQIREALERLS